MKIQTLTQCALAALGLGLVATAADAETISIEPDNYVGSLGDVAPGATLSNYRLSGGVVSFASVYSMAVGSWAPTGNRVFAHRKPVTGLLSHHWDNTVGAYNCDHNGNCVFPFAVFRVDFDTPTTYAAVLTTVRGETAMDGMELQAFDVSGERIARCIVLPISSETLETGILPAPRLAAPPHTTGAICGKVVEKKNCVGSQPGNCDYVVQMRIKRAVDDVAYVWFGGPLYGNTYAPVDKLQYAIP